MTRKDYIQNVNGIWSHAVNGRVIAPSVLKAYGYPVCDEQRAAYDAELGGIIDDYRKARLGMTDEQKEEEAFERLAAHGPGVDLVNILTGERFKS